MTSRAPRHKRAKPRQEDRLAVAEPSDAALRPAGPLLRRDVPSGAGIEGALARQVVALQSSHGNSHVQRALEAASGGMIQRAGKKPKAPPAPTEGWQKILHDFNLGSDPSYNEPIDVAAAVNGKAIRALDLESLILLDDGMKKSIARVEEMFAKGFTGSRMLDVWLYEAKAYYKTHVKAEVESRRSGIELQESFWPTIDEAKGLMNGTQRQILFNILPLVWKAVETNMSPNFTAEEKVRAGYLTRTAVQGALEAPEKAKHRDPARMAERMNNAATEIAMQFSIPEGGAAGARTAARLASVLADIENDAVQGQKWIRQEWDWDVEPYPVRNLGWALDDYAEKMPRSVYGAFPDFRDIKASTATDTEQVDTAIKEIDATKGASKLPPEVEVEWQGKWWAARVLASDGGRYFVHYVGYDKSWDEWIDRDRLRERQGPAAGEKRVVLWDGIEYEVKVVDVGTGDHEDMLLVHWLGYGADQDSWIYASRVLKR